MKNYALKTPIIQNFDMKYYVHNNEDIIKPLIFPPHLHDELEIYFLIEGDVSFMVEQNLYKLNSGDIIITKPNEIHNCILNSSTVHKHFCFWFDISCDFLFKSFTEHEFGKDNLIRLEENAKKEILSICNKIHESSIKEDKQGEFIYSSQLIYLLSKKVYYAKQTVIPSNLQKILDYINQNFVEIESIDSLANMFFISRSTLCRLFSNYLHTSPKLYLETKRLANSRKLLKYGKSVFDACIESGFPDYSNYIRLFKKRFGITPKQYKDSN
ncbi:MAG: helix-turn-helix domain-containing protein [Clostridia bacterium]|nr:helix-turn-helix domain-containing protein [Clostridia bacterium]